MILGYPGGPLTLQGSLKEGGRRVRVRGLKTEDGATSQGMQGPLEAGRGRETILPSSPQKELPATPPFIPVRPADLWRIHLPGFNH